MIADLKIPVVGLPKSKVFPPYYLPACASGSSTMHPDFRDPAFNIPPNAEAGQEPEREIEAVRALVQAFEDGASEGVKEGTGKRKGDVNFLASVFANLSMVSVFRQRMPGCMLLTSRSLPLAISSSPLNQPSLPPRTRSLATRSHCSPRSSCTPSTPTRSAAAAHWDVSRTVPWTAPRTPGSLPASTTASASPPIPRVLSVASTFSPGFWAPLWGQRSTRWT